MKTFTAEEMSELLGEENIAKVNEWLARNDGIAVYVNADLGSPEAGHRQFMSFGSNTAQFVVPPERLPDFSSKINWRYSLEGTYRGRQLAAPVEHAFESPAHVLEAIVGVFTPERWTKQTSRVISYGMDVKRFAHGPSHVTVVLDVTFRNDEPQQVNDALIGNTTIRVTTWTNDAGQIDRLAPFSWSFEGQLEMTGSDPNLGGALVSIANLAAGYEPRV